MQASLPNRLNIHAHTQAGVSWVRACSATQRQSPAAGGQQPEPHLSVASSRPVSRPGRKLPPRTPAPSAAWLQPCPGGREKQAAGGFITR
jgi:hypothetical protein